MRVLSVLFQSAIPLVNTEMLFSFQMLILHFAFLRSSPYSVAPSLNSHSYYTQTHTFRHTLCLFTSDVVLSVFPPVDHLVVAIEEVLCKSSIGSIIGTEMVNGLRYYYVT